MTLIKGHKTCDFLVIGAGIIGVTVARELRRRYGEDVLVIDKESSPAQHASGRNSGVLHSGIYYSPNSLKAKLCVEGNRRLKDYCRSRGIPINDRGKVIVVREERELPMLDELSMRAKANGVNARLIDAQELRNIEPSAKTLNKALFVSDTANVNARLILNGLVEDSITEKVKFEFDCAWHSVENTGVENTGIVSTTKGPVAYGHLINCAGLFADKIAHTFGVGREYRILPFRGTFFRLSPQSRVQVKANIYPVPDLRYPFLGVHFTTRPTGEIIVGPTALPLLGREQYEGMKGSNLVDAWNMTRYLFRLWKKDFHHIRSVAWAEIVRSTQFGFFSEAGRLVNGLIKDDLVNGVPAGIRAQLVHTKTGDLINDFVIESGPRSTHVLNAVSPAFTCSLPFAECVVDRVKLGE